jgi:stearoyl-CoA desaturase (delta-9 desaturase)
MWEIGLFLVIHHFASLFSQTFFHHRYSAHRMFTMNQFWEKFFFIFSWLTMGSSYLSPTTYALLHRQHHDHADTEKDVHSPKYDKKLWRMMWRSSRVYTALHNREGEIDKKYLVDLPEWKAFDDIVHPWAARVGFGLLYIGFYLYFATHWWLYLFLPIHFLMGPLHGAIINWFAHKVGYRNHKVADTSTNMFPIDLIMLGEGLHNNHHKMGTRANFAQRWFEFDPAYVVILLLHGLRVIKLKK